MSCGTTWHNPQLELGPQSHIGSRIWDLLRCLGMSLPVHGTSDYTGIRTCYEFRLGIESRSTARTLTTQPATYIYMCCSHPYSINMIVLTDRLYIPTRHLNGLGSLLHSHTNKMTSKIMFTQWRTKTVCWTCSVASACCTVARNLIGLDNGHVRIPSYYNIMQTLAYACIRRVCCKWI